MIYILSWTTKKLKKKHTFRATTFKDEENWRTFQGKMEFKDFARTSLKFKDFARTSPKIQELFKDTLKSKDFSRKNGIQGLPPKFKDFSRKNRIHWLCKDFLQNSRTFQGKMEFNDFSRLCKPWKNTTATCLIYLSHGDANLISGNYILNCFLYY